jgi:inorganic pyrophosphatase
VDEGEADDKIIAVLANDPFWASADDISDVPDNVVARLDHYFRTYKLVDSAIPVVEIEDIYDRESAERVVVAAMDDYSERFPRDPGSSDG